MYNNEFFVVDMASCTSTGEIINNLSLALETLNHSGKKIVLKLNESYLNQSQMLSIQSLITSYGCSLDTVETTNEDTQKVAENMNIFVQKPIEKRIEEKYESNDNDFEKFSMDANRNITVKEVNGLHFEADLDAIQKQQDNIDISSDLKNAGISPNDDFEEIEQKVSAQYAQSQDLINQNDDIDRIENPEMFENQQSTSAITAENKEFDNTEKNTIGVYKKAYKEENIEEEHFEDVDFYETATDEPVVSDTKNTTYINQTLRSGQVLEAEGNVVIIGDCHPGSEVRAGGDITVWGVLSGIAHAGYKGNIDAKVRALKLNAIQLRIGNCYSRRPDGTNIPYIIRSSVFTPEEARVVDDEIILFKINQN